MQNVAADSRCGTFEATQKPEHDTVSLGPEGAPIQPCGFAFSPLFRACRSCENRTGYMVLCVLMSLSVSVGQGMYLFLAERPAQMSGKGSDKRYRSLTETPRLSVTEGALL